MRNTPECLITGAVLVTTISGKADAWVRGDLHRVGLAYVFNCVLNEDGESQYKYGWPAPPGSKTVTVAVEDTFERRGVIVFATEAGELNTAALERVRP